MFTDILQLPISIRLNRNRSLFYNSLHRIYVGMCKYDDLGKMTNYRMHYTNGPSVSQIMAYIKLISIDQDVCGAPPNSYPLTHYNVIVCLCKQSSIIATHHYLLQCRLPYMISPLSSHSFVKKLAAVQYSLSVIRSLPRVIVVLNHTLNWGRVQERQCSF